MAIRLYSYQNAKRRRFLCACSKCAPSLGNLCDLIASTADDSVFLSAMLAIVLRASRCFRRGGGGGSWTQWDRSLGMTGVHAYVISILSARGEVRTSLYLKSFLSEFQLLLKPFFYQETFDSLCRHMIHW